MLIVDNDHIGPLAPDARVEGSDLGSKIIPLSRDPLGLTFAFGARLVTVSRESMARLMARTPSRLLERCSHQVCVLQRVPAASTFPPTLKTGVRREHADATPVTVSARMRDARSCGRSPTRAGPQGPLRAAPRGRSSRRCGAWPSPDFTLAKKLPCSISFCRLELA
jgi:hypothetical protein